MQDIGFPLMMNLILYRHYLFVSGGISISTDVAVLVAIIDLFVLFMSLILSCGLVDSSTAY